ncbi:hypothetical protein RFI_23803, partial [Reticulomyxa filosa]
SKAFLKKNNRDKLKQLYHKEIKLNKTKQKNRELKILLNKEKQNYESEKALRKQKGENRIRKKNQELKIELEREKYFQNEIEKWKQSSESEKRLSQQLLEQLQNIILFFPPTLFKNVEITTNNKKIEKQKNVKI